jgi:hypothetical protein
VLDAILQFERRANLQFAGYILHDAEDVISPLELRLFNYLVDRKDLIQLPVYPFARRWSHFTSGHYMDEFAELHGKDIRCARHSPARCRAPASAPASAAALSRRCSPTATVSPSTSRASPRTTTSASACAPAA